MGKNAKKVLLPKVGTPNTPNYTVQTKLPKVLPVNSVPKVTPHYLPSKCISGPIRFLANVTFVAKVSRGLGCSRDMYGRIPVKNPSLAPIAPAVLRTNPTYGPIYKPICKPRNTRVLDAIRLFPE